MKDFFPMPLGDAAFLIALLLFSFVSFLPWSQRTSWNGMAMLGWMMALLMVLSPAIALLRLIIDGNDQREPAEYPTGGDDGDRND